MTDINVVERVRPLKYKRIRARRYPFAASVELTDLETEIRIKEQTKDLNLFGCKVDTKKTLPEGTKVRIRITHAGRNVVALGRVVYTRQTSGMGIAFTKVESSYESVLESWIAELRDRGGFCRRITTLSPLTRR